MAEELHDDITEAQQQMIDDAVKAALEKAKPKKEVDTKMVHGEGKESQWTGGDPALLQDKKGGFKNMGHFFHDVAMVALAPGEQTDALPKWAGVVSKTAGYMEGGQGSLGGYTIPVEFRADLLSHSLEAQVVKPRCTTVPMQSNRIEIPCMVDSDHSSNFYGGISVARRGERGSMTQTGPTFGKVGLTLHETYGLVYVTNELLRYSAISMAAVLKRMFTESIGFQEDDDYLNGSGASQPVGALNSANPSLITVTAETGQGAATIVAENVIKMYARLHPRFHNTAVWLANPETFPQLAVMSLAVGTGGVPVWMPAGGLTNSPYQSLMGRPLIYTEKCQALGTAGDIALCAFSEYLRGVRAGSELMVDESMHVNFTTNEMAYRFIMETDGQPWWLAALTPKRGSATLGCFIVLNSTRT